MSDKKVRIKKVSCSQLSEGVVNIIENIRNNPGTIVLVNKGNCHNCAKRANTCSIVSIKFK